MMSSRLLQICRHSGGLFRANIYDGAPVRNISKACGLLSQANTKAQMKNPETDHNSATKPQGRSPEDAILVASPTDKCIVGCTCSPDHPSVNWFYITEGEAQTCNCGYYFKLIRTDPKEWIPEYSQVMHVDDRRVDPRLRVQRKGILKGLFGGTKAKVKKAIPPASMPKSAVKEDS